MEDDFTSVQWDRASPRPEPPAAAPIAEEPPAPLAPPEVAASAPSDHPPMTVAVTSPISDRDGSQKPHISYLVESKSALGAFSVRRRYGDFRFLHDCLNTDFPHVLVPPLPPKLNFKYFTGDTFSTAFVHKRLHSLNRFLQFVAQHTALSQLAVLHYFLSDTGEWTTFTQNLKVRDDELLLVNKVNEELTETVMNFFTLAKHKRETNKDILEMSDKLKKLYENLVRLDRIFNRLNKKHGEMAHDYEQFSVQLSKLALVDEQDPVSGQFAVFAALLLYFSGAWGLLQRFVDESFLVALKDCAKYILRFTDLIELQHNRKIDLQVLQEYLAKAQGELQQLGGAVAPSPAPIQVSGGLVTNTTQLIKDTLLTSATAHIGLTLAEGKRAKLQRRVLQLEAEIETQTALVAQLTTRILTEEYPNWERFNKTQLKSAMVDLCDEEIGFYKGLVENWSGVEAALEKRLAELL